MLVAPDTDENPHETLFALLANSLLDKRSESENTRNIVSQLFTEIVWPQEFQYHGVTQLIAFYNQKKEVAQVYTQKLQSHNQSLQVQLQHHQLFNFLTSLQHDLSVAIKKYEHVPGASEIVKKYTNLMEEDKRKQLELYTQIPGLIGEAELPIAKLSSENLTIINNVIAQLQQLNDAGELEPVEITDEVLVNNLLETSQHLELSDLVLNWARQHFPQILTTRSEALAQQVEELERREKELIAQREALKTMREKLIQREETAKREETPKPAKHKHSRPSPKKQIGVPEHADLCIVPKWLKGEKRLLAKIGFDWIHNAIHEENLCISYSELKKFWGEKSKQLKEVGCVFTEVILDSGRTVSLIQYPLNEHEKTIKIFKHYLGNP